MTRETLPPDHNDTCLTFPRGMRLNEHGETLAFQKVDVCNYGATWWACIAVLSVIAAVVIVGAA